MRIFSSNYFFENEENKIVVENLNPEYVYIVFKYIHLGKVFFFY